MLYNNLDFSGITLSVESASEIADSLSKAIPGIETLVLSKTHEVRWSANWQSHQTSSNTKGASLG